MIFVRVRAARRIESGWNSSHRARVATYPAAGNCFCASHSCPDPSSTVCGGCNMCIANAQTPTSSNAHQHQQSRLSAVVCREPMLMVTRQLRANDLHSSVYPRGPPTARSRHRNTNPASRTINNNGRQLRAGTGRKQAHQISKARRGAPRPGVAAAPLPQPSTASCTPP